jgi:hypothetical protein
MSMVYDLFPNRIVLLAVVFGMLGFGYWLVDWSFSYSYGTLMGMLAMLLIRKYEDAVPDEPATESSRGT